ncbi:checkpoint protein HUS1-like [Ctenocephalides felis]|uniref:checkpoint protein HUS1-like n=1 Tax=Ctenocephalides felis TaxID=7515 RepID=UPI000E6E401E|nr:checkpoint protein HUS1-like [Ctenocephalides felis]
MKFRGVMVEKGCMKEFHNITMMLSRLSRECVMRLTSDKIFFVVTQETLSLTQPPLVWCELDQRAFFNEYIMTGVDDEHNEIYLSFGPAYLNHALVTLKQNVKLMNIKLAKKDQPCLSLKIEQPSISSQEIRIVRHDIPVIVIPRRIWTQYEQPVLPEPDISIIMPSLKRVKNVLERVKTFSPYVEVEINKNGYLTITSETDMTRISVYFNNLVILDNKLTGSEEVASCQIKIKKLLLFLSAEQVQHTRAVCTIKSDLYVHISLENQNIVNIQCYIPTVE